MNLKEATDALEQATSYMANYSIEDLAEAAATGHPTHQQNVMRFALAFVSKMAENQHNDLRNAESIKVARKIRNYVFEEHQGKFYTPPLPFV